MYQKFRLKTRRNFVMGVQRAGVTLRGQGDIYMLHPRKLGFVDSLPPQSRAPYFHATSIGKHSNFVPHLVIFAHQHLWTSFMAMP